LIDIINALGDSEEEEKVSASVSSNTAKIPRVSPNETKLSSLSAF
jgi:hypothetical protein